ncbi:DNA/RNA helicase domain-containing protein [Lactococcus nasutitermitis]|uniref:DNA/RNA helicase domain-containing protein n=1 Tax=Lactococcus nasutitermitis TaxID=1652957 RepID=A0ABV9JIM9_9LACT|nr:DNA/RNA helicase domain-containing protein [Lactococcus nasutitermitis]
MTNVVTVVKKVNYSESSLSLLKNNQSELLTDFPTVYFVYDKKNEEYTVYVGETNNVFRRTKQHFIEPRDDWQQLNASQSAQMLVFGNEFSNKSVTLDLENKFMNYFLGVPSIKNDKGINNRRGNPQGKYYPKDKIDAIFKEGWKRLNQEEPDLFPDIKVIENSALFKSSPFKTLSESQQNAQNQIIMKIEEAVSQEKETLILVTGSAGSGKTVLLSNVFYNLQLESKEDDNVLLKGKKAFVLVNHNEQLSVYQQISRKLGLNENQVMKPNSFLKKYENEKVDIVIVDEGHLLATRNGQAFPKKYGLTQLEALRKISKIVVLVFDEYQILTGGQYVDPNTILELKHEANLENKLIELHDQHRMQMSTATNNWLNDFIWNHEIDQIPHDDKYELKIFDNPTDLYNGIKEKSNDTEYGLSRMLASYDWDWKSDGQKWCVEINNFSLPWNYYYTKASDSTPWAENPDSIKEVGSTFTIQGFDLNYAGVIIGPSVKYNPQDKKIFFDADGSKNKKAIEKKHGIDAINHNLNNELNVLLTRGVHGLYICACDESLQKALLEAQKGNKQ